MELHPISKMSKTDQKGFTLIEILLVLALMGIVCVGALVFGLPSVTNFACSHEKETLVSGLIRARSLAAVTDQGSKLVIEPNAYKIYSVDGSNDEKLVDELARQNPIPTTADHEIIFQAGSDELWNSVHVQIGPDTCRTQITINNAGAII